MTRMERRKQRQRQRMIWLSISSVVLAATAITVFAAGAVLDAVNAEPAEIVYPSLVIEEAGPVPMRIITSEPVLEATDESEDIQEDFENEKIEEALLESGYLHEEIPLEYDLQACAMAWCETYGVPYGVALGVIETESTFRAGAVNGPCVGYMQINSCNLRDLEEAIGVTDLGDSYQNVHSGIYMLGDLYEKYGDWHKALIAYNCGEGGAKKNYFEKGLTSSTYSRTVMARADKWKELVG